jgi:hypothetical protein
MSQPGWFASAPRGVRLLIYLAVAFVVFWTIWFVGYYLFQTGGSVPPERGRGDIVQTP